MSIVYKGQTYSGLNLNVENLARGIFQLLENPVTTRVSADGGSVSAPSYTFNGDTDTGMFRYNTDVLGFGTNGTPRVTVSDDTSTFFNYVATSTGTGLTAAGTTTADAYAITKQHSVFSTVASNTGARLPAATAGTTITIYNRGANALKVYPNTGGAIDLLAANAAYSIAANAKASFTYFDTNVWESFVG